MDRRDDSENPNSHSDEQFQKAYEVISLSYKGDEPEHLYRKAIACFDSLIEISHGNETIREFAQRRSIDMKYLVDGASFVISKMHFNPENNYYITLGLPQNATPEELSRRWKKFMLLYHPDKQVGNEEWVSERAKKVNEAYTALKDDTRRTEYDRRLADQMMSRKFPAAPSHGTTHHHRPTGTFSRRRSSESNSGWNSIRPYLSKILLGLYLIIALSTLGYIYIQNRPSHLEAELAPAPAKARTSERTQVLAETAPATTAVEQHTPKIVPAVPVELKKDPVQMPPETKNTTAAASPLQTIKNLFRSPVPKQAQEKVKVETKEGSQTAHEKNDTRAQDNAGSLIVPLKPSYAEQIRREDPPQQQAAVQKVPTEPVRPLQEVRQQAAVQKVPAEPVRPLQEVRQQAAVQTKTEQITKEEVEEFMEKYVRAYTKNDLNAFLSLFSRSALENNSLTYNDIRNAYSETFSEKINQYKIINMDIRTDGQTATVSGIYNLNRYLSAQDRWVRYSGKIVWRLIRENHQLRIISTNYDK